MEFCSECSKKILGKDFHDFAGLISREQEKEGYGVQVHCNNCGDIFVDAEGTRLTYAKDMKENELERSSYHETLDLRQEK